MGCGEIFISTRPEAPVKVDGFKDEWTYSTFAIANPPSAMGVMNDDDMLYLMFSTRERAYTNSIMSGGLTLDLETPNGEFHLKAKTQDGPPAGGKMDNFQPQRGGGMAMPFEISEIEISNDGKIWKLIPLEEAMKNGLDCFIDNTAGEITAELSIPLNNNILGLSLDDVKGQEIKMKLASARGSSDNGGGFGGGPGGGMPTGTMPADEMSGGSGGGGMPGGGGSGGGMPGGGMSGGDMPSGGGMSGGGGGPSGGGGPGQGGGPGSGGQGGGVTSKAIKLNMKLRLAG